MLQAISWSNDGKFDLMFNRWSNKLWLERCNSQVAATNTYRDKKMKVFESYCFVELYLRMSTLTFVVLVLNFDSCNLYQNNKRTMDVSNTSSNNNYNEILLPCSNYNLYYSIYLFMHDLAKLHQNCSCVICIHFIMCCWIENSIFDGPKSTTTTRYCFS